VTDNDCTFPRFRNSGNVEGVSEAERVDILCRRQI
jgi:hypothetical protein